MIRPLLLSFFLYLIEKKNTNFSTIVATKKNEKVTKKKDLEGLPLYVCSLIYTSELRDKYVCLFVVIVFGHSQLNLNYNRSINDN